MLTPTTQHNAYITLVIPGALSVVATNGNFSVNVGQVRRQNSNCVCIRAFIALSPFQSDFKMIVRVHLSIKHKSPLLPLGTLLPSIPSDYLGQTVARYLCCADRLHLRSGPESLVVEYCRIMGYGCGL